MEGPPPVQVIFFFFFFEGGKGKRKRTLSRFGGVGILWEWMRGGEEGRERC